MYFHFRCLEKAIKFQFVGWLPFFDSFPHILVSFPVFKKIYKFSVCWFVSYLFFDPFPQIFGTFPVFRKVINFQFVGRFPFLESVSAYFRFISGFQKSYEFPVCWSVFCFFIRFCKFCKFLVRFGFQSYIISLLVVFLFFFRSVSGFQKS